MRLLAVLDFYDLALVLYVRQTRAACFLAVCMRVLVHGAHAPSTDDIGDDEQVFICRLLFGQVISGGSSFNPVGIGIHIFQFASIDE